jgi:dihydrofolate reductase
MSKLRYRASMSLDGFVARQGAVNASTAVLEEADADVGALVMGRNMFGGGPDPWGEDAWNGWWGEDPPFHLPVVVLTHHDRDPLELAGGTSFTFVSNGIGAALELAREAAGGRDVIVAGGAGVSRRCAQSRRPASHTSPIGSRGEARLPSRA